MAVSTIGPYRILERLGSGAQGDVFLAEDTRLHRRVALKALSNIRGSATAELRRRVLREARAAARLNHPNIAAVYDVLETEATVHIVMEYVSGTTLAARARVGPLPPLEVLDIALQLAGGLAHAHSLGVIHRDLKPANIIISPAGQAKILDFGLARLEQVDAASIALSSSDWTGDGQHTVGTPPYMPPEHLVGEPIDACGDIYSLGVTLFELLTGRRPFQGRDRTELVNAILTAPTPRPRSLIPEVPAGLDDLVFRAMARDRNRRYESATVLEADLQLLRAGATDALTRSHVAVGSLARRRSMAAAAVALLLSMAGLYAARDWGRWPFGQRGWNRSSAVPEILPLTSLPGVELSPALSPDGKQIAFCWDGEGEPGLYVKLVAGGNAVRLAGGRFGIFMPAWSPDGGQIAFGRHPDATGRRHEISVIPALGGPERRLTVTEAEGHGLAWAPDGRHLAIVDKGSPDEPDSIFLLDPKSGSKLKITSPPRTSASGGDRDPSFAPDGQSLAFVRYPGDPRRSDVYVVPLPEGDARRLAFNFLDVRTVQWTPDGNTLVFAAGAADQCHLWSIPASGGSASRMAVGEDACEVTIARTVARLAYVRFIRDWNIWRAPGPAGDQGLGATRFIYSTRADVLGAFSPDGDSIAFVSTRSGHRSLWTCDREGQNCRDYQVRPAVESLRWSPDGRRIAFAGWDPDTAKLDVYNGDVDTGFTRNVTAGIASDGEPSWSHDGHWMYFSSNRTGEFQVWKMPSDGGAAVQITKRGGFRSFESDDGRWLYYCNPEPTGGVWRVPVDGGAEVQLLARQLACTDWALWKENLLYFAVAAPGRGLSFEPRVGREEGPSIEIMDLNSGHARRLRPLETTSRHLAVSSDGRWLLYSQDDGTIGDLMLVDDFR